MHLKKKTSLRWHKRRRCEGEGMGGAGTIQRTAMGKHDDEEAQGTRNTRHKAGTHKDVKGKDHERTKHSYLLVLVECILQSLPQNLWLLHILSIQEHPICPHCWGCELSSCETPSPLLGNDYCVGMRVFRKRHGEPVHTYLSTVDACRCHGTARRQHVRPGWYTIL